MPLTKTQARVLSWMNNPDSYIGPGCICFAGIGRTPEMVGMTLTKKESFAESIQVHMLVTGRFAGNGKAVQMEPDQAREVARILDALADRADQLRREESKSG